MIKASTAIEPKELRKFGLIFGFLLALIFGLVLPYLWARQLPRWPWDSGGVAWPWIGGGVAWAWALVAPATLLYPYRGWMALGNALGWVNSRILLSVVYYLMILPVGLVLRLTGHDAMARRRDPEAASYRVPSRRQERTHMEKPY